MPPVMETPPLTRGRLNKLDMSIRGEGNTPAYAGKTPYSVRVRMPLQKHPRLRGEDNVRTTLTVNRMETPPLTRGRLGVLNPVMRLLGNTPAYAGKTTSGILFGSESEETPPLTRGRRTQPHRHPGARGNTPAYAGKTWRLPPPGVQSWKHPRLRGEDRAVRVRIRSCAGNTPAYAGKTEGTPDGA